ncbi:unnamed protein product [Closterium sp. NIES-64]|nr:unnamed protein product [Closterium sp. NIES-64]
MASMKQKAGDMMSAAKEKMAEVSAKTGEAVAKGKAEVQESMDKARHPTSREARAIADAKEAQRKEHAELEKERKIAGAMEREAAEKEARHEKHGVMGAGTGTALAVGLQSMELAQGVPLAIMALLVLRRWGISQRARDLAGPPLALIPLAELLVAGTCFSELH